MKARARRSRLIRPLLAAAASVAMATSFSGCALIEWLTCVQYGTCGQIGEIVPPPDNVKPDAPTNFAAIPGDGQITFTWTPSTALDVEKYEVAFAAEPGAPQRTHVLEVQGRNTMSAVATGLTNGQTLYYVVYAHDRSLNRSDPSNEIAATPVSGAVNSGRPAFLSVGGPGAGNGQFNRPSGVATARFGSFYVTDKQNYRVQRFNPDGSYLQQWGGFGTGNGQFQFPHGIATDSTGAVYVTDLIRKDVQKFDSAGNFLTSWSMAGPPFDEPLEPRNIAVGRENVVYVTTEDNYVYRFTPSGVVVSRWGSGPFGAHNPGDLHDPDGIATDPSGNVYVTNDGADRVEKFTWTGEFIGSWGGFGAGDGQFDDARGITHAPSGSVFVADTLNHRVQEFSPEGAFRSKFGSRGSSISQFDVPVAIASDCRSRVYVVDEGNNRVLVFGDPEGPPPPCTASPGKPVGAPSDVVLESAAGSFRATLSTSRVTRGRLSQSGARVDEKAIVARGRFSGRLGARRRGLSMLAPFTAGGTWRTRFDVRADLVARSGTARGYTLAIARRKSGGRVCLRFSTRFAVVGDNVRVSGTFRAAGGTGAGGRLIASGRFRQAYRPDESFTLSGSGNAREGRRRAMPAACRRLAKLR